MALRTRPINFFSLRAYIVAKVRPVYRLSTARLGARVAYEWSFLMHVANYSQYRPYTGVVDRAIAFKRFARVGSSQLGVLQRFSQPLGCLILRDSHTHTRHRGEIVKHRRGCIMHVLYILIMTPHVNGARSVLINKSCEVLHYMEI